MPAPTLFTTFIKMLGVPHTASFSDKEYKSYPPKLAFMAFEDLLYEYGVDRRHIKSCAADATSLHALRLPCVVQMRDGSPHILTAAGSDCVALVSASGRTSVATSEFLSSWSGDAIEASPMSRSTEPDLGRHRFMHAAVVAEHYAFWVLIVALASFFFVANRIYDSWSLILLTVLYALGVMFSWMLTLKQNNVQSTSAEAVCSMIQPHGCNTVINSDQSTFLGLYHWSEIGLTYFSVSLAALLLHPAIANYLAYISIACLPYTFWSVYTQHWRIHSWCTLCLCVQGLFWAIFGISLGGGHLHHLFPLRWDLGVLLACYALALLFYHKIVPAYFAYERRTGAPDDASRL